MPTSSSQYLPRISPELTDVLFRTSLINTHRKKAFALSFTATLLGFLASKMPLAQWFRKYVETHGIDVEAMMSSRKVNQELLDDISAREPESRENVNWLRTVTVNNLFEAASRFRRKVGTDPTSGVDERHLMAAYIYYTGRGHQEELKRWGFDVENWSNAFLVEMGNRYPDELKHWIELHRETFETEPEISAEVKPAPSAETQSQKAEASPRAPNDQTQLLLDSPSTDDILGRRYFARLLAVRMNHAWETYAKSEAKGSFMLHIHGAWGSGKSSVLNLLREELQPKPTKGSKRRKQPPRDDNSVGWIVIDFNAWQRQRVEPPWWSLIDTVYTQACSQLKSVYGDSGNACKLMLKERWWRVRTGRRDHLVAVLLISTLVLGGLFYWARWRPTSLEELIKGGATLLGVVAGIWSTVLLVSRSLISGSSQSAQAFMQSSGDPMERVSKHFVDLTRWIKKPVAIFVDDLDRCQTAYVVTLLEGIQTLFNVPRVVYVITADRRWLNVCFEKIYEQFVEVVKEPGRQLGSLFLEKAFESSISMPRMTPERKKLYWDHLIMGTQPSVAEIKTATDRITSEFKNDKTETEVLERLKAETGDPLLDEIRKGAAVLQLASQEVMKSTEYFLKPFAPLAEPNPRAMKRLVNGYTFLRDLAVWGGSEVLFEWETRNQLALWAIVSLRWPLLKEHLEEYLEEHPDEEPNVIEKICNGEEIPITENKMHELARHREVIKVFNGEGIGTKLDKETICALVGISAAQPKSGGVA